MLNINKRKIFFFILTILIIAAINILPDNFLQGDNEFYSYDPENEEVSFITKVEREYIYGSLIFIHEETTYLGSIEGTVSDQYYEIKLIILNLKNNISSKIDIQSINIPDGSSITVHGLSLIYSIDNKPIFTTILTQGENPNHSYFLVQFDFSGNVLANTEVIINKQSSLNIEYLSIKDLTRVNSTSYYFIISLDIFEIISSEGNYIVLYNQNSNSSFIYPLEKNIRSIVYLKQIGHQPIIYTSSIDEYNLQSRSLNGTLLKKSIIDMSFIRVNTGLQGKLLIGNYINRINIDIINVFIFFFISIPLSIILWKFTRRLIQIPVDNATSTENEFSIYCNKCGIKTNNVNYCINCGADIDYG